MGLGTGESTLSGNGPKSCLNQGLTQANASEIVVGMLIDGLPEANPGLCKRTNAPPLAGRSGSSHTELLCRNSRLRPFSGLRG